MKTKTSKALSPAPTDSDMVSVTLDWSVKPSLSAVQKAELAALRKQPDSEIDYSDIPPLTDEFWKNAIRNPFYKPNKQATTVRVDADVLMWLKGQGKGYQTRINAILRAAMLNAIHQKV
jgi:uncharacterized protein (DUF4415 family)